MPIDLHQEIIWRNYKNTTQGNINDYKIPEDIQRRNIIHEEHKSKKPKISQIAEKTQIQHDTIIWERTKHMKK